MSAYDRLERLLYVLPRAAQPDGAQVEDLSRALGVSPEDILADIEAATSRVFYHDGGYVDPFNLSVHDGVVRMYGRDFQRPVRLTQAEAMALGLGLRVLAAEAEEPRRSEILALANQLEAELVTPELELRPLSLPSVGEAVDEYGKMEVAFEPDDFRGDIAEAVEHRQWCDVVYLKPGASEPVSKRIAPVRLVYTHGHWYVRAFERGQGEVRTYRLDRVLELHRSSEKHEFTDVPADRQTFSTEGGQKVQVRYSRAVARWVAERENVECEADGTVVVTHDVVDTNWLIRHVLQYGGEAVVETEGVRGFFRAPRFTVHSSHQ